MEGKSGLGKLVSMSSVSTGNVQLHKDSQDEALHCCMCQYSDMLMWICSRVHNMVLYTLDLFALLLIQPNVDV